MPMQPLGQSREEFAKALEEHRGGSATDTTEAQNGATAEEQIDPETEQLDAEPTPAGGEADEDVQAALEAGPEAGEDQGTFQKRIVKMLNRSQRKAADARKEYEGKAGELEELKQKAKAYDLLSQNPDALNKVKELRGALGGDGAQHPDLVAREKSLRDKFDNPEAYNTFMEMIELWGDSKLMPKLAPFEQVVSGLVGRHIQTDWDGLKSEFGDDIDKFKDKAFEESRGRGLSLRQGLLLATDGAIVKNQKATIDRSKQKRSITTPANGNGTVTRTRSAGAASKEDRVKMLAQGGKRLSKLGASVPWFRDFLKD